MKACSFSGSLLLTVTRWEKLNLVRVYTKPKGKLPDYTQPVVLRSTKCTVEDFVSGWVPALLLVICFIVADYQ